MKKISKIDTNDPKKKAEKFFDQALDEPSIIKRIALTKKALEIILKRR